MHAEFFNYYNLQELLCVDKLYKIGVCTILSVTHGGREMEEGWSMVGNGGRATLADK